MFNDSTEVNNSDNKWNDLIEKAISKKSVKYYDSNDFQNVQDIGSGGFAKVYRAKWKNEKYFALKSFFKFDKTTAKEIVREIELQREVDFRKNIINFYGVTKYELENELKNYLLVMEYADSGTLRNYLKNNFNMLTWNDKYKFAYQLASAVSCLHNEGIVHRDLHYKSVLINQNIIKLSDFGLSRRIEEATNPKSGLYDIIPYVDPKAFNSQVYKLNEKSDVYSVGTLLWEISSGQPPFYSDQYDASLAARISQGERESIISNTPDDYVKIYTECWNNEPNDRPTINEVVDRLKAIMTKSNVMTDELNLSNTNNIGAFSEPMQIDFNRLNISDGADEQQLATQQINDQDRVYQTIRDLTQNQKENTRTIQASQIRIKDLQEELDQVELRNKDLQNRLKQKETQLNKKEKQNQELTENLTNVQEHLVGSIQQITNLQNQLKHRETSNSKLKHLQQDIAKKEKQNQELTKNLTNVQAQLVAYQNQIEKLKGEIEENKNKEIEFIKAKTELDVRTECFKELREQAEGSVMSQSFLEKELVEEKQNHIESLKKQMEDSKKIMDKSLETIQATINTSASSSHEQETPGKKINEGVKLIGQGVCECLVKEAINKVPFLRDLGKN